MEREKMKVHLPLGLRLSSGDIFRSSIIFVVIIASLVFASVRAVAVDNGGSSEKKIRISKFAEDNNGKELLDAELAVYKGDYAEGVPDSTKAIDTWKTGSAKDLSFGEGTYTLVEKSAPQGYGIASNIVFKVKEDKVFLKDDKNWSEIKKFVPEDPKGLKAYSDFTDDNQSWSGTPFGKFYYIDRDDKNESANADEIIYCFNLHRKAPLESSNYGASYDAWGPVPTFKAQYNAETLFKYAENPRIKDPKKFGDAIQRVIYAGHPRNHKKFGEGLTPTAFRTITQMAIYNFTDSFGLEELAKVDPNSNEAHGFAGILRPENAKIKKAYEDLVAYAAGNEPVPADMRTPLYVTSDNKFQNFVGTWIYPESVLPVIEMIDPKASSKPSDHEEPKGHGVLFSVVDLGGKEVVGAKFRILKGYAEPSKKPEVAAEWETVAGDGHTVKLAPGKYKLEQKRAPQDFRPITTVEFEVDDHGAVKLTDEDKVVNAGKDGEGKAVLEARVQDNNVITLVDGQVTLNTNAYDADAPRWDNTLDSTGGTIADAISYKGLVPGKKYRVKGELMDKTTKKPLDVEKIDTFTAEAANGEDIIANGEHIMKFNVDASLAGKSIVVFETIYEDDGREINEDTTVVARHADIDSASQTIVVDSAYTPKSISTQAYNKDDVNKGKTIPADGGTVVDVVTYKGLKTGNTYTISGELMDKETQKGTGITSQKTFTADGTDGEVKLEFIVGLGFAGKDLVVFETLRDDGGFEVATHEDIGSASQTVSVASLKESSGWEIWAAGAVIGAGIIGLISGNGSSAPDTGSSNVHPSLKPSTQPSVAPTSVLPNADKSQEKTGKGSNMLAKTGASILGLLIAAILFTLAGFGLVSWRRKN
ncbi:VaFE repeat-containing surface-anchored protein [Corynebacterium diphtheriae]|uniref:VaFE repeat-containing surface-anchored protein n=1 Tax=Corynebacterium diphtheriae TaxID=1717 RepID=UPI0015F6F8B4